MGVTLFVRNGGLAGQTFSFNAPSIPIGRDHTNVLKLAPKIDGRASGKHCELFEDNGTYFIRDLGSTNGTYVNNKRIFAPTPLTDGSLLKLGGAQGVEIVVKLDRPETPSFVNVPNGDFVSKTVSTADLLNPPLENGSKNHASKEASQPDSGFARLQPMPARAAGANLLSLYLKLDDVKTEVRNESRTRFKKVAIALGGLAALVLISMGLGAFLLYGYYATQSRINVAYGQIATANVRASSAEQKVEGVNTSVASIKQQTVANQKAYDETRVSMARSLSEKEADLRRMKANIDELARNTTAVDSKRKEADEQKLKSEVAKLQTLVTEVKSLQNNPANKAFEAIPENTFVATVAQAKTGVYAIYFTAAGQSQQTLVGTAFAIDAQKGLLATAGNLGQSIVETFLPSGQVTVVCNSRSFIKFNVTDAKVHSEFATNSNSRKSPDVAILKVDLASCSVGFPYAFKLMNDAELEQVPMAQNVAMLSFPDEYRDAAKIEPGSAMLAKLAMGVVSSSTRFSGASAVRRPFDLLEHTCAVGANDQGSPIFDERGRVVAIQSHSESELFVVVNKTDPDKPAVRKLPVGNVKYAASVRFLRDLAATHFGGLITP